MLITVTLKDVEVCAEGVFFFPNFIQPDNIRNNKILKLFLSN